MTSYERLDRFIGDRLTAPRSGGYLPNEEPKTGKNVAGVADGDGRDIEVAVATASAAFPAWRDARPIVRGRTLMRIATGLRERQQEFAAIEALDTGRPILAARVDTEVATQYFESYAGLVNALHSESIDLGAGYYSFTRREPFGIVGVILPWNAPLNQASRGIAPALAAGNVVIAKPPEKTSSSLLKLARFTVEECDLPTGVLNVVLGAGPKVGAALVGHPAVRKVAFTGSVRAGREIGRIAGERIIPVTLERGGNSANIIFEDANLDVAIPNSAWNFTMNAGQVCSAGTRLLVHESIHDPVVERMKTEVQKITVGPGENDRVGPLTTKAQYENVQSYYQIANEDGAKAVLGGALPKDEKLKSGWFVSPTVYAGVNNNMRIAREEIFGPVVSIIPLKDDAEAVAIANDSDYGLAARVWTQNLSRALRVSSALQVGQVAVNECLAGGVETPFGGYKQSGYGREKGVEALRHYTQLKCVTIKL